MVRVRASANFYSVEGEKENQSQEMAKNKKKMRGSRGGKKNREKKLKQLKLTLAKKIDSPHLGQSYSKEQLITIWKCQAEKVSLSTVPSLNGLGFTITIYLPCIN